MATPLPTSLGGRFDVDEVLLETPFERAFRAHDKVLQRDVLLKLPARAAFDGWSAPVQERLLREARALAKVRHENIAPIHWVEATPEGPLLVLDLPAGELLAERLARGRLDGPATIALGVQIAGALAHVHLQGVVHRAVGPSSIRLLANGKAQLGAFTFAKEFGQRGQGSSLAHAQLGEATRPEHLPDYAAPEQLAGHAADPRADVFALGCTLFRCLAGQDPFPPGQATARPLDLRTLRPDVDRGLAEVIHKCLLFGKTARYATAQEVLDALQALGQGAARRRRVPRRGLAALGVAGLVLVLWLPGGGSAAETGGPAAGTGGERLGAAAVLPDARYQHRYEPDYARVHGLFVAIGAAYTGPDWSPLRSPVHEVDAVVARLRANDPMWSAPDAVTKLLDEAATSVAIMAALDRISRTAKQEDAVLVYFSGHGTRDGRAFALCASDAHGPIATGGGYLRREALLNFTDRCEAKHVLVVLDCCHSSAIFDLPELGTRGRAADSGSQPGAYHRRRFSREFLCSAGADERASDGDGMSPFCRQLLTELARPADAERTYLAARHLAGRIEEAMEHGARGGMLQVPAFRQAADEAGSFVFQLAPK
jgi:hypothetical protein